MATDQGPTTAHHAEIFERHEQLAEEFLERRRAKRREELALERLAAPSDGKYVWARLPRCPACGGTRHHSYRSVDNGDGTRTKHTQCKDCHEKFLIVLE